jgi:ribosomal protein S18 acetylase RimI-like enzyme
MLTWTPVARLILVEPGFQFKAVESDPLCAKPNLGDVRAYLRVESVPIHAEITGRVLEPHNAGLQNQGSAGFRFLKRARLFRHVGLSLLSIALSARLRLRNWGRFLLSAPIRQAQNRGPAEHRLCVGVDLAGRIGVSPHLFVGV